MISEGLAYSKPGVIELLRAWSPDLPNGSVPGIRCRTQATIDHLAWDLDKRVVTTTISSLKDQWVTLYVRQGIKSLEADTETKPSEHGDIARKINVSKGSPVQVPFSYHGSEVTGPFHLARKKLLSWGIFPSKSSTPLV